MTLWFFLLALLGCSCSKNVPTVDVDGNEVPDDAQSTDMEVPVVGDIPDTEHVRNLIAQSTIDRQQRFLNLLNPAVQPQINNFADIFTPFKFAPNVIDPASPVNLFYPLTFLNPNLAQNMANVQNAATSQLGSLLGMDLNAVGLPNNPITSNLLAAVANPIGNPTAAVLNSGMNLGQLKDEIVPTSNDPLEPQISGITPCGKTNEGVCVASSDCNATKGGTRIGSCLGCTLCDTCCVFKLTDKDGDVTQTVSFLESKVTPNTGVARKYTINPKEGVCQIRLDLEEFTLPPMVSGVCADANSMTIVSTKSNVLGEGNSKLCGNNKGQHLYLEAKKDQNIELNFKIAANAPGSYSWSIKVTQVICELHFNLNINPLNSIFPPATGTQTGMKTVIAAPRYFQNLKAPDNCLQYYQFTALSANTAALNTAPVQGVPSAANILKLPQAENFALQSFNYDEKVSSIANYDYNICIRRPLISCGIKFTEKKFDIAVTAQDCKDGKLTLVGTTPCCTVPNNGRDAGTRESYFGVKAISDGTALFGGQFLRNLNREHFCGSKLGPTSTIVSVVPDLVKVKVYSRTTPSIPPAIPVPVEGTGFNVVAEVIPGIC